MFKQLLIEIQFVLFCLPFQASNLYCKINMQDKKMHRKQIYAKVAHYTSNQQRIPSLDCDI